MEDFEFPWEYSFPPFFTIQPNLTTREKQLEAWTRLILEYHKASKQYLLDLTEAQNSPLFNNKSISRKLPLEGIKFVLDDLQKKGNVEWLDKEQHRCYVYWRTPSEWGKLIYDWAVANGMTNTVCTLFELMNGDETVGEEFHGLDAGVLKKALLTLQDEGKAELMEFDDSEGVKFF